MGVTKTAFGAMGFGALILLIAWHYGYSHLPFTEAAIAMFVAAITGGAMLFALMLIITGFLVLVA